MKINNKFASKGFFWIVFESMQQLQLNVFLNSLWVFETTKQRNKEQQLIFN